LQVWQLAIELVSDIYKITRSFPREELYGLTGQIRRAAVSVPSNIAEGQGRVSQREFHQFLGQARGSLMEVETQLVIATKLGYLDRASIDILLANSGRVKQMLYKLMQSLTASVPAPPVPRKTGNGRRVTGNDL
jgi:four helix bundle protein